VHKSQQHIPFEYPKVQQSFPNGFPNSGKDAPRENISPERPNLRLVQLRNPPHILDYQYRKQGYDTHAKRQYEKMKIHGLILFYHFVTKFFFKK